jgi:uncharacterized damage-inducible protein DinB
MKKLRQLLVLTVAGAALTLPVYSQDAPKKDAPPKATAGPSQTLLESWNDVGRKLTTMAEDFPEDKYDFKPTPAQRSFAEQLLHAAGANYIFIDTANGKKVTNYEDPKRADYKTKAAIAAYVKQSFADGAAVITKHGDKGMSDQVVDPYANQYVQVSDMAWGLLEHSGEHYGQLVGYYRMAGLVPPESRPKK